jgi:hypothetical protein
MKSQGVALSGGSGVLVRVSRHMQKGPGLNPMAEVLAQWLVRVM